MRHHLAAALIFFVGPAHAAGLWNFDQGAANYHRGGANIAAPSDPTAVYLNPAALAGHEGFQVMAQADFLFDSRRFERAPDSPGRPRFCCRETEYPGVENSQSALPPSPGIWLSGNMGRMGLPKLTIAAALYGPPRNDTVTPATGPQRYVAVKSRNLQTHAALAAGYELPWRKTRVGLTAMLINQYIDTSLALNPYPAFGFPEDRGWDAVAGVKARDENIPAFIAGVSTEALPHLTVAASYQHSYDAKAEGHAGGTIGEELDELAYLRSGKLGVKLSLPAIARGAVRYDAPSGRWDVEGAFVYENWSRNSEVLFKPKQPGGLALVVDDNSLERRVPNIAIPTHFRDTWSVRLGGEFDAMPGTLAIRSGVFYERAAIAPEWISMGNFDLDKIGVSAGARYDFKKRGWIELGGGYQHWMPLDVKNSRVKIIDPLTGNELWPIANGKYSNTRMQLMIGAGLMLGRT